MSLKPTIDITPELFDNARAPVFQAPVNRAVYEICRREFARPDFQPWDIRDVWREAEEAPC